jgi:O-methyltransferase involved in polyketide biosynthesis
MEGIGATALMTAASRALETERGDEHALLSDELA